MEKRVVIAHDEYGVYLGSFIGLGFWSKLDPAGQDSACTFKDIKDAAEYAKSWDSQIDNIRFVEVEADLPFGDYPGASISACVAAGLPAWTPNA